MPSIYIYARNYVAISRGNGPRYRIYTRRRNTASITFKSYGLD